MAHPADVRRFKNKTVDKRHGENGEVTLVIREIDVRIRTWIIRAVPDQPIESRVQEENLIDLASRRAERASDLLEQLRLRCLSKGFAGILKFSRNLDLVSSGPNVDCTGFVKAIHTTGIHMGTNDTKDLFARLDTYRNGYVKKSDVVDRVRPPMSMERYTLINKLYDYLKSRSSQKVFTVKSFQNLYNAAGHQDVTSGRKSEEQILSQKAAPFVTAGDREAKISKDDFMSYYSAVSTTIVSDSDFEDHLRYEWYYYENEGRSGKKSKGKNRDREKYYTS